MSRYQVTLTTGEVLPPSRLGFETVERKGLGHPDTLSDLIAEVFVQRYARHCHERFGFVPNHSADKVLLAGADTVVKLGGYEVIEPIGAYFFGKVTRAVGGESLPVEELFAAAVDDVLTAGTRYPEIVRHTARHVRAVVGSPLDHHPGYYNPESLDQLESMTRHERLANDTVACAAAAGRTPVEDLVLGLERYVQGPDFADRVAGTGSDVKVLAVRQQRHLDVTLCLPFHPEAIESWEDYGERVREADGAIREYLAANPVAGVDEVRLNLNQRDVPGRGYLAPFGTCLGKGDVGVVGRGNRYSGLITPGRAMSVEAPAGKNLMHHSGKLYSVLAQWIADAVLRETGIANEVVITSRVGAALDAPGSVCVNLADPAGSDAAVRDVVAAEVARVDDITSHLLSEDPLERAIAPYGFRR
ncbi:MAG TPA: methionine adenosyltransferase [Actinospica sp.]|jgi:S-adenosylmethionine synthetase|nr:methionine adenosyltransferase [Actinospica sp.]